MLHTENIHSLYPSATQEENNPPLGVLLVIIYRCLWTIFQRLNIYLQRM